MRIVRDDSDAIEFAPSREARGTQFLISTITLVLVTALARPLVAQSSAFEAYAETHQILPLVLGLLVGVVVARSMQPYSLTFDRKRRVLSILGGWQYFYPTHVEHNLREIFDLAYDYHSDGEGSSWSVELWLKWGDKKHLMSCSSEHAAKNTIAQRRKAIFE